MWAGSSNFDSENFMAFFCAGVPSRLSKDLEHNCHSVYLLWGGSFHQRISANIDAKRFQKILLSDWPESFDYSWKKARVS
jgi:hypothetical protein